MDKQLKSNIGSVEVWIRLAYILLFAIILYCAVTVFWVAVLVQFLFVLISAKKHIKVAQLMDVLCQYLTECFRFISFNSDHKPFPFSDLPVSDIVEPFDSEESAEQEPERQSQSDASKSESTQTETKVKEPALDAGLDETADEQGADRAELENSSESNVKEKRE